MSPVTPPLLAGVDKLETGDSRIYNLYQGIALSVILDGGAGTFEYMDGDTVGSLPLGAAQAIISGNPVSSISSTWPHVRVTCTSGPIYVGLV